MKKLELKNNESYELTDEEGNAVLQGMVSKDTVLIRRLEMAIDPKMISRVYTPKTYLGTKVYVGNRYRYCIRLGYGGIYSLQKTSEICGCGSGQWDSIFQGSLEEVRAQLEKNNVVPIDEHIASTVKGNNTLDLPSENKSKLLEDENNF